MITEDMYPIYDITEAKESGAVETVGSKAKEWITYNIDGRTFRVLAKEGRLTTGENWAEKVASELAALLGSIPIKGAL